jgi:hypothetical protein
MTNVETHVLRPIRDRVGCNIWGRVQYSVRDNVGDSVRNSVRFRAWNRVWVSVVDRVKNLVVISLKSPQQIPKSVMTSALKSLTYQKGIPPYDV